ncbi:DUF3106 domain-containing protein [Lampropedia aestuarii]|uniref:DUF3106 domain-containing protein n=1 Tax=Lampropedia aestuarii TaxID=2562762 RepID=A0A4S5BZW3_9BURK|nr:DUF3106 domain-containing protein [Lampropedia aestuarii]THJ35596.1 DUF3106 domain-containing protein [Lampropedia aestuarii]
MQTPTNANTPHTPRWTAALSCFVLAGLLASWQQLQLPLLTPSLPIGLNYAGPLMLAGDPQLPLELRLHLLPEQNQADVDKAPRQSPSGVHITRPVWSDLSSDNQATLAGLEAVWPFISNAEKRRWLAIAKEAKGMSDIDRERLSLNITNWGYFNENQRQALRQQYRGWDDSDLGALNQAWESYRALAPDVRAQLAKAAEQAKAPAKPAARRKNLVRIPAANQARPGVSNLPKIPLQPVDFAHPTPKKQPSQDAPSSPPEAEQRPVTAVATVSIPEPEKRPAPQTSAPRVIYWYGIPITPPEPVPLYTD